MDKHERLAQRFEAERGRLRGVAYRMLGSLGEAEDAVQEAWLRLGRADSGGIDNLEGWLTTVVARVCLDMLRSRKSRGEQPLDDQAPVADRGHAPDPEEELLLADSVGLALLVVLDTLEPAERLAFVLHDMFAVPFEEIASIVGRSPAAARQLASRARRRVQGQPVPDPDLGRFARLALVNGSVGVVTAPGGKPFSVGGVTVRGGKIVEIDILADPERLARLDLTVLDD